MAARCNLPGADQLFQSQHRSEAAHISATTLGVSFV